MTAGEPHEEQKSLSQRLRSAGEEAVRAVARGLQPTNPTFTVETTTLYRPVGPKELELIEELGWLGFPPRLPEQPIFYPVLNEEYATEIARDWNVKASGAGFVTRFEVEKKYLERYPVQTVGAGRHQELWVPAEELEEFNRHIVGLIEVVARF